MAPFLPLISLNRSQSERYGRGPGAAVLPSLDFGDQSTHPASGKIVHAFYADLGQPEVRRDIQRHAAIGDALNVGSMSQTLWSDMFRSSASGFAVSGVASTFNVALSAGTLQSRIFGTSVAVAAQTPITIATKPAFGTRTDLLYVNAAGAAKVITGTNDVAAPVYDVQSFTSTGIPTGGTFTLGFNYLGYNYVTGNITYTATAAAVATAIGAATGTTLGFSGSGAAMPLPTGTLTGSGSALGTGTAVVTASGLWEGPITNMHVVTNALTGGTNPSVTIAHTTTGVGGSPLVFGGSTLPVATILVPSTATSSSNYTFIQTGVLLTA